MLLICCQGDQGLGLPNWEGHLIQISGLCFVIKAMVLSSWDPIAVELKVQLTVPGFFEQPYILGFALDFLGIKEDFYRVMSGGG